MTRNFWIIALVSLINSLSFTILIPTIYLYGRQFGLSDLQTSFLFSIYSVAQFFATPIIGKLSDRFGRKPLLLISLAGTVIANLIAGMAPTAAWLFSARLLDGITGGNVSVAQAVISDVTNPEQRAKGFGINGAAFGLGFVLGPIISLLAQKISLGASFLASSAIASIALTITFLFLPETLHPSQKSQEQANWFDFGLGNLFTGLVMPRVGILLLLNFLIGTTFTIFTYAFQPFFIYALHQTSQTLTLMFVLFGLLGIFMQTKGISLLKRRFNIAKILLIALLVRSISFVLMPIWENVAYFVVISILFSMFNSLVQPMITTLISLNSSPEEQGVNLGLNSSYLSVANAVGPVLAGMLIHQNNPATYSQPLYLAGVLTFLVFVLAAVSRDRYTPSAKPTA